jgi:hypothetical protein
MLDCQRLKGSEQDSVNEFHLSSRNAAPVGAIAIRHFGPLLLPRQ